ncbi:ParA family protein [Curvibacter sp. APW13]|uniref:ParA family protein n=1 Tax=Curvibacter sp. APW13 TaxID=3077236 RepID=UPI0028DF55FA|nr:ParA family protein [Curvibacter sp. APW13]MDT8992835.1 ParA family protein [Curvibacter sp. APW13]
MIILVGNGKGGVGKSRLAIHLAALAVAEGVDTALLDTDVIQGSSASWSRIRNEEGISPNVPVMLLPQNPLVELASLSNKYDLVVVDIGAQNYKTMVECAAVSDLVLVPCGNDQQEMEATMLVFKHLESIGPKHKSGKVPAYAVLSRVSSNEKAKSTQDLREVFESSGIPVLKQVLPSRTAWGATGKTGRALHELRGKDKSDKATAEMRALYEEVKELAN